MDVYIVAPEGKEAGLGHVRRCATLKAELAHYDLDKRVILLDYPGLTEDDVLVAKRNGIAVVLSEDYRGEVEPDVYIDANLCFLDGRASLPWKNVCLGPGYALLPKEYRMVAIKPLGEMRNLLITLGGSDPYRVAEWLSNVVVSQIENLRVIEGPHFPMMDIAGEVIQTDTLLPHLQWADAVICGGGQTLFEVCRTQVPAIVIEMALDQRRAARTLGSRGASINLGWRESLTEKHVRGLVESIRSQEVRKNLRNNLTGLVDGLGAQRCAEVITNCQ